MTIATWFLDIPAEVAADPAAPYAVLPVPYERSVSYGRGTAAGPEAILRASHETEDFDEELRCPVDLRVQTLPPVPLAGVSPAAAMVSIRAAALAELRKGRFLLSLGGEHTITAPLAFAARETAGPLCVLQLDAHLDLREQYLGDPLSHACVLRRVREAGISTVHVGIRSCSAAEHEYAVRERVPVFWAADVHAGTARIEDILSCLAPTVYVTVDMDVFDPSLVPGTGTPEPGGLGWAQVTALLRRVCAERRVVAADLVELAPIAGQQVSEFVAARVGAKLLLYHQLRDAERPT